MIWLGLLLVACDGPAGGSGDDGTGDEGSGDGGSGDGGSGDGGSGDGGSGDDGGAGDAKVSEISSECTDSGFASLTGLSAVAMADGVHVIDSYPYSCCATFDVTVAASVEKHWVTATYTNVGKKCDCMCLYDVRYVIDGLESGTWTIESPTGATVDVAI
jgi:hypothetical protein